MRTSVLLFASFRELKKTDCLEIDLPEGSVAGDVFDYVCKTVDEAKNWRRAIKVAVNDCYVSHETPLHEGDRLALIPPVEGG